MRRTGTAASGRMVSAALLWVLVLTACGGDGQTAAPPGDADETTTAGQETGAADDESSLSVEDLEPLSGTFTWFPAFHTMAIFVADGAGYWSDLNLNVEMQRAESGSAMYAMLAAGQTDWTNAGIDVVAQAQSEGQDIIHVFPAVTKMSLNMVVRNEKLKELGVTPESPLEEKLEALTQMTIGYTSPNSPTDVYSRYLLKKGGIDPETQGKLVSIGSPPNLLAALRTGQIDAFMLTPPTPNVAEIEGFGTVFIEASRGEIEDLNDFPYSGFSAREEWLQEEENHEATVRFVAGLIQAGELIRSEPDQAIEHLAAYFPDMEREALEAGFEDMIPSIPDDPALEPAMVQRMINIIVEQNIFELREVPSAEEGELWTNLYVEEARELLDNLGE